MAYIPTLWCHNWLFIYFSEEISVDYYSTLAERRRLALAEALEENEQLHRQIEGLKGEIDSLREENSMLKPLAEEAEYLAGVLKVKES